jgi:hypothetical protein
MPFLENQAGQNHARPGNGHMGYQRRGENKHHHDLKSAKYKIKPKKIHYDCLEIDEFWTQVGKKKNKVWLIYAYHREAGKLWRRTGGSQCGGKETRKRRKS